MILRAYLARCLHTVMPPALASATPAAALQQVAGYTARQAAVSCALLGAMAALAWRQRAFDWTALVGLMLAPVLVAGLAAQASRRLPRLSWTGLWLGLALLLGGSAAAAPVMYRWWGVGDLSAPQLAASVGGFGVLMLALPLWHLHSKSAALRLASMERAALAAQLKALQAQIEPHFLYNTLANTRYLVRHDTARALQMLDHLIGYLRASLPDMRQDWSTLGRECALAEHYLSIMRIRFGERMAYRIDCPDEMKHAALPPLMLMSLVENAVQHGVEPALGDVCVQVAAYVAEGRLHLVVRDDGGGAAAPGSGVESGGGGMGLANLRARLAAHYGGAAGFTLRIEPGRPTEAELFLPLEMPPCEPPARPS